MIPEGNSKENIERFSGFAELYDRYRPEAPQLVVELLGNYLGRKPDLVMDLGCGTGLSTLIWGGRAERVIGVEPNADMRSEANRKLKGAAGPAERITFVPGYSNRLDTPDNSVDIITCSQSFHWMEPVSTLKEAHRVLKRGGVFAIYDCDWPPVLNWELEKEYLELTEKADDLVKRTMDKADQAVKRDKNGHLGALRDSGAFRFTREIVFHNAEHCDAERFIGLALSQGGIQTVFKLGLTALDSELETFRKHVEDFFQGESREIWFGYRLRLGVK
ncbi:class I SAM-dependent methyltransferase [Paenibacillus sp. alder61]|uniref:class I SAM-dependent methyltransferase n=1 Tax=Paenibacillus sp. alder61 TaxID=2862948 RepID=UPI001CD36FA4|nr:class I SAM-dependent methyltransferase [Paenibacillus sp. alder61]MCA1294594.1 class I SAM-dependent methyltransferase [Paenibacillus sp. alder61]